jgi:hypothetical protein
MSGYDETFVVILNSMVGSNCALYGCPTSRTREFSIFKIPVVGAADVVCVGGYSRGGTRREMLAKNGFELF